MTRLLFILVLIVYSIKTYAQCTLACYSSVTVEMNANCEYLVTDDDLLDPSTNCPSGVFSIDIQDNTNTTIPTSPLIDNAYVGQTLTYFLTDNVSGNSCFGNIQAIDTIAPVIVCTDVTINCAETFTQQPTVTDACSANLVLNNQTTNTLTCDPENIAEVLYNFEAVDVSGNTASCDVTVTVSRIDLLNVIFPANINIVNGNPLVCNSGYPTDSNGNPDPSATGQPTYLGNDIYTNQLTGCNVITTYSDLNIVVNVCVEKIIRTWEVTETWCGSSVLITFQQEIEIVDNVPPIASCIPNLNVLLGPSGQFTLIPADLDAGSTDDCSSVSFSVFPNTLDCDDLGTNILDLVVSDECGNTASCSSTVVVQEDVPPSVICISDVTVNLDSNGEATLLPSDLLDAFFDQCDPSPTLSISQTIFFCNDAGNQVVTLTATDASGNSSSCFSNVTVIDFEPPTMTCIGSIFYNLDASTTLTFNPADAVVSLNDNCPGIILNASQTTFDCSNLGSNSITITAIDASGNTETCLTTVEILDPSGFCIPASLILTGTIISSQTFEATNFIQFDATVPPGVSIILQAPEVFTVNGCEVLLGGELEINP